MIATHIVKCGLPRSQADDLNRESGWIYTAVTVEHWRIYRKKGIWLKQGQAEKLNDRYDHESSRLLHSHSIDAAQQGFYKACKTTRTLKRAGDTQIRYPYKRKRFRTTVWKDTGIRLKNDRLALSLARGSKPITIPHQIVLIDHHQRVPAAGRLRLRHLVGLVGGVGQVEAAVLQGPALPAQPLGGLGALLLVQPLAQEHVHVGPVELSPLLGQLPVGVVDQGGGPDHQRGLDHLLQEWRGGSRYLVYQPADRLAQGQHDSVNRRRLPSEDSGGQAMRALSRGAKIPVPKHKRGGRLDDHRVHN